jgi:hypothetical protein
MSDAIAFAVVSALQQPATVEQLARTLAPHPMVVHHDHGKQPGFALSSPNVRWVPDPQPTGRGTWSFLQGVLRTVRHSLDALGADYVQLLSPTCLPIRPLAEFEASVAAGAFDAHIDLFPLLRDADTLMTFAYRNYAPEQSLRYKVLRRAGRVYFGRAPELVQDSGLSIHRRPAGDGTLPWRARAALALTELAAAGHLWRTPLSTGLVPMMGSTWFGARRRVWEALIERIAEPAIVAHFSRLWIPDEVLLPTLIADCGFRVGPSHHAISAFIEGSPKWIDAEDLASMSKTGRFFARKFRDDPQDPVRLSALARVSADR